MSARRGGDVPQPETSAMTKSAKERADAPSQRNGTMRRNPRQNKTRTPALRVRTRRNPLGPPRLRRRPPSRTSAPARETLRVGARVLAAYWNEKREFEGFWLATVKRIEAGEYILEWFDAPGYPPFKSRPQDIAVPHPEFRVSGK